MDTNNASSKHLLSAYFVLRAIPETFHVLHLICPLSQSARAIGNDTAIPI